MNQNSRVIARLTFPDSALSQVSTPSPTATKLILCMPVQTSFFLLVHGDQSFLLSWKFLQVKGEGYLSLMSPESPRTDLQVAHTWVFYSGLVGALGKYFLLMLHGVSSFHIVQYSSVHTDLRLRVHAVWTYLNSPGSVTWGIIKVNESMPIKYLGKCLRSCLQVLVIVIIVVYYYHCSYSFSKFYTYKNF